MYNKLLLFAILVFTATGAMAQKGFHIGANASFLNTYLVDDSLYGDVKYKPKFTYGPMIGIAAGNNFTNQFGIEIGVNYARLGQAYEFVDSIGQPNVVTSSGKITLDYIQVPVQLKITGGDFKSRFTATAGPQFGFLANAYNRRGNSGTVASKSDYNAMDIGLLVTAGGDISLTNDLYLNLSLKGYYGFTQANDAPYVINRPSSSGNAPRDQLHNAFGGFNVGIHYIFRNNENPKNQ